MLIANPIYDTVFKYLMEDNQIARTIIGAIIGREVVELDPSPQEHTVRVEEFALTVFRLDYKAVIKTDTGELHKVIIELQKSAYIRDVERFRRYIGENYKATDMINGDTRSLPIIAIFILGEMLNSPAAFIKVCPDGYDIMTNQPIPIEDDFIRLLNHESYFIQIRRLELKARHRLETILSVFNQSYLSRDNDKWVLNYSNTDQITDPDLRAIAERLSHALLDTELLERVIIEEEVEHELDKLVRQKLESDIKAEEEKRLREATEELLEEERRQKDVLALMLVQTLSASGKTLSEISVLTGLPMGQVEEMMKR